MIFDRTIGRDLNRPQNASGRKSLQQAYGIFHVLCSDSQIHLCSVEIGMTKKLLDGSDIGSTLNQKGSDKKPREIGVGRSDYGDLSWANGIARAELIVCLLSQFASNSSDVTTEHRNILPAHHLKDVAVVHS